MKKDIKTKKHAVAVANKIAKAIRELNNTYSSKLNVTVEKTEHTVSVFARNEDSWMMTKVKAKDIIEIAEKYMEKYERLFWGIECGTNAYKDGTTYSTPMIFIQVNINQ